MDSAKGQGSPLPTGAATDGRDGTGGHVDDFDNSAEAWLEDYNNDPLMDGMGPELEQLDREGWE